MLQPLAQIARDPALRLVVSAMFLVGCVVASIAPYQSLMAIEYFGMSDRAYSAILVVAAIIGLTGSISIGILTDQHANRRRVAILSAILMIAGGAVVAGRPTPASFVLTHAVIWPVAFSLYGQLFALSRLATARRPTGERDGIMAAVRALFALPFIAILPLWALAFSHGAALLNIYLVATLAACLCLAVIVKNWPRDGATDWPDQKSGLSFAASLAEITSAQVLSRVALTGSISAGTALYMVLTGLLFHQAPGRDAADTALFVGIVAGLEVPFMLATATLLGTVSKTTVLSVGALFYALFLCAFPLAVNQPWVWLLTVPAGLGAAVILSVPVAYLQDLMAGRPGAGSALLAINNVVAQVVSALVFAVGAALSGYVAAAILGAVVVAVAAVAIYVLDNSESGPGR